MFRTRMHHERLLVDLLRYRSYLVQDPCANQYARTYVEAQISFCQSMNAPRNDCTGSGELAGWVANLSSSGRSRFKDSNEREIVTT